MDKNTRSYWNHTGRHQAEYARLVEKLVPDEGRAETTYGELLRAIGRVYYDWYNNGGGNLDLPRFQFYLYMILEWAEEIDERSGVRSFQGTNAVMRHLIAWSRSNVNWRLRLLQTPEWEAQLELLVDAIVGVVFDRAEAAGVLK